MTRSSHASCIILSRTQTATRGEDRCCRGHAAGEEPHCYHRHHRLGSLTGEQILKAMSTKDDFKARADRHGCQGRSEEHAHED